MNDLVWKPDCKKCERKENCFEYANKEPVLACDAYIEQEAQDV